MYKIYALVNNKNDETFYVGQSKQKYLSKRKHHHIEQARKLDEKGIKATYIRNISFDIKLLILEEGIASLEEAYIREQYYIDLYRPPCNISDAKSIPPYMAGHNKTIFPKEMYELLGTMPDYKLAKLYHSNKYTIARIRKERNIESYAQQTGNNGTFKVGTAKGTVKGFYTKIKPEIEALMGTMPDKKLAELAGLSQSCIFHRRKYLRIKPYGNNSKKKNL